MRTLVLDQGYQPHRIISWQRAVCMIFDGKVEVVEEFIEFLTAASEDTRRNVDLTIKNALTCAVRIESESLSVGILQNFRCAHQ